MKVLFFLVISASIAGAQPTKLPWEGTWQKLPPRCIGVNKDGTPEEAIYTKEIIRLPQLTLSKITETTGFYSLKAFISENCTGTGSAKFTFSNGGRFVLGEVSYSYDAGCKSKRDPTPGGERVYILSGVDIVQRRLGSHRCY